MFSLIGGLNKLCLFENELNYDENKDLVIAFKNEQCGNLFFPIDEVKKNCDKLILCFCVENCSIESHSSGIIEITQEKKILHVQTAHINI